jgi:hypothetical protein
MTVTAEDIYPAGTAGRKKGIAMAGKCESHERLDAAIKRQEEILEDFRKENAEHREYIAKVLGKIVEQVKTINEIKNTQLDNMRRRDLFTQSCEAKRADIFKKLNALEQRQNKKDGALIIIASICTGVGAGVSMLINWMQKQ